MRCTLRLSLVLSLLVLVTGPTCHAHPVPRENHDRTILVRILPEGVVVDYRLEVDEWRATQDLPRSLLAGLESRRDLYATYARYHAPLLAGNLTVRINGQEQTLSCDAHRFTVLDHVRCDFRFRASWKLADHQQHTFEFREGNYELDDVSAIRLALVVDERLTAQQFQAPDEELINRSPDARKPGDGERLRRLSVTFSVQPQYRLGSARPALEPDLPPSRPGARGRERRLASTSKEVPQGVAAWVRTTPPPSSPPTRESEAEAETETALSPGGHSSHLLDLLFDSKQGLAVLLLMSALFGAGHALTPGHGKTLTAAYLVGERGTVWHALVLGLMTTLSHTWAVIAVAIILQYIPGVQATVQVLLGLVGGLLIAGLGLVLLLRRLRGQADHIHLFSDHSHGAGGELILRHSSADGPGWWGVIVLGLVGGIVPCTDAVLVLMFAASANRLWLALPLVLAFSAGLAAVLVGLGIGVVHARRLVSSRLGDGERFQRVARALPLISAALITVLGLWMCFSSVAGVK